MNYIVLGGGISPEKDVSKRSATAVRTALETLGHTVTALDPADTPIESILDLAAQSNGVFPILHGEGGEDGTIQKHLEAHDIPYFGPDTQACDNTFNKVAFKKILEANNLPTPRWNTITSETFSDEPLIQKPFVIKPIEGGSSIDTFIVRSTPFDSQPILEALSRYDAMLIEELIEGDEITVGVLDSDTLPVIEIIPPADKEFDYENKYNGATQELCPPVNVSESMQQTAQELAHEVHKITHCRHLSRTDILINRQGELFVIDTNTIPGLTNQSLFPKAAAEAGLDWATLVDRFTRLLS